MFLHPPEISKWLTSTNSKKKKHTNDAKSRTKLTRYQQAEFRISTAIRLTPQQGPAVADLILV
jgi:hypothetical protein